MAADAAQVRAGTHGSRECTTARRPTDSFLAAADLDIHDPIGGSLREFRRCAGDVAPLMDQLAALMHPGKSSKAVTALAPSPLRSRRALPCRR